MSAPTKQIFELKINVDLSVLKYDWLRKYAESKGWRIWKTYYRHHHGWSDDLSEANDPNHFLVLMRIEKLPENFNLWHADNLTLSSDADPDFFTRAMNVIRRFSTLEGRSEYEVFESVKAMEVEL